jgi:hypothetical protein
VTKGEIRVSLLDVPPVVRFIKSVMEIRSVLWDLEYADIGTRLDDAIEDLSAAVTMVPDDAPDA